MKKNYQKYWKTRLRTLEPEIPMLFILAEPITVEYNFRRYQFESIVKFQESVHFFQVTSKVKCFIY